MAKKNLKSENIVQYHKVKKYTKYRLIREFEYPGSLMKEIVVHPYVNIDVNGNIKISKGYTWDGATAIPDTNSNMRAALVHDALYQMIRVKKLDPAHRKTADKIFRDVYCVDGVSKIWAGICYIALRIFGCKAAKPNKVMKKHQSPA